MGLDLSLKVLLGHWIICILSKQDSSGVIEEDKMKYSFYTTQSI